MKKHLEFNDGKSSKFWKLKLKEDTFTVRFGKTGTVGQRQRKEFDSEEKAEKEAQKLINAKLKNGYIEIESDGEEEGDFS